MTILEIMRIGADLHALNGKFQGSKRYLENIYRNIAQLDSQNDYMYFVNDAHALQDTWLRGKCMVDFGTKSSALRLAFVAPMLAR